MALARIADTSRLYALFNDQDGDHEAAVSEAATPWVTLVPAAVMNELLDLVRYRHGKETARRDRHELERLPHFDLWYPTGHGVAVSVWETDPHSSLHDAHVVALARKTGFPLASFDRRQREAVASAEISS